MLVFASICAPGLTLLTMFYASALQGAERAGQIALINAVLNGVGVIAPLGLNIGIVKNLSPFVSSAKMEVLKINTQLIITTLLSGAVLGSGCGYLAGNYGAASLLEIPHISGISIIVLYGAGLGSVFTGVTVLCSVADSFGRHVSRSVLLQCIFPCAVFLSVLTTGVEQSVVITYVEAQLRFGALFLALLYIWLALVNKEGKGDQIHVNLSAISVIRDSFQYMPLAVIRQTTTRLETLIGSVFLDLSQVGRLAMISGLAGFISVGQRAILGRYAKEIAIFGEYASAENVIKVFRRAAWDSTVVALLALSAICIMPLISSFVGVTGIKIPDGGLIYSWDMIAICVCQLLNVVCGPAGLTLNLLGRSRLVVRTVLVVFIFNLLLDIIAISLGGYIGAVLGVCFSVVATNIALRSLLMFELKHKGSNEISQ